VIRYALCATLLIVSCRASAPFVRVHVVGPSNLVLGQLAVTVHIVRPGLSPPVTFPVPSAPARFNLPRTFTVELPDHYRGNCAVDVSGSDAAGMALAAGSASLPITHDGTVDLTVSLGGGTDLGLPDQGPLGCPGGALVCEGFEGGVLPMDWIATNAHGTLTVNGTQPHSGQYSLEATIDASGDAGVGGPASSRHLFAPPTAAVAARVWYYGNVLHDYVQMLALVNVSSGIIGLGVNALGTWELSAEYGPTAHVASAIPPAVDRWTCVELVLIFGASQSDLGPAGRALVYIDGQPAIDHAIDTTAALPLGPVDAVDIGLFGSSAHTSSFIAYFDDVVVAQQATPIGCN
jgi:hypothetical protein